jgi:hypothetical protein
MKEVEKLSKYCVFKKYDQKPSNIVHSLFKNLATVFCPETDG